MSSLPTPHPGIKIVTYAHVIIIVATNTDVNMSCDTINAYSELVCSHGYVNVDYIELSTEKCSATFTHNMESRDKFDTEYPSKWGHDSRQ